MCLLLWRVPGGTSADRYKCPGVHYVDGYCSKILLQAIQFKAILKGLAKATARPIWFYREIFICTPRKSGFYGFAERCLFYLVFLTNCFSEKYACFQKYFKSYFKQLTTQKTLTVNYINLVLLVIQGCIT